MESKKNKISFVIFIVILIIFAVGGFFCMKYFSFSELEYVFDNNNDKKIDYRIDTNKDYIYFENVKRVVESEEIDYKDIVINLKCASELNQSLKSEEDSYRNSVKYLSDVEIPDEENYEKNDEGIYSLSYRDYYTYTYKTYISVVLLDFDYDILNSSVPKSLKSLLFDKENNTMLSESEILNIYDTSLDKIKDKIKVKLNAEQVEEDGVQIIDVDDTLLNFDYALYINKIGKLEISYIVRSTKQNYYDNIVMD